MKRVYEQLIGDQFARHRQMAFLSGPRQVGKTTLSEMLLPNANFTSLKAMLWWMTAQAVIPHFFCARDLARQKTKQ